MVPPEKGNDVNDLLSQYRRVIGEPSDIQGHLESFVEMVLHTDAKVVVAQLPRPADIVFIDTSHLYDQTVAEIELYQHLVRPGGLMVFHDTELARPEGAPARPMYPVRVAVQEYAAAEGRQWHNATH